MRLAPFNLHQPESLEGAVDLLAEHDENARPVSGGTALIPMIRFGLLRPGHVVSLHRIPGLRQIEVSDGTLRIGALATHRAVASSEKVSSHCPLLARAAVSVATPAIRNSGTIGGNVSYAEAASDPAPALLALESTVHLWGPKGERSVPIIEFFRGFYEADIQPSEVVYAISVPTAGKDSRFSYLRYAARSREDKPLVNVAVMAGSDGIKIGLGGVSPTPIRAAQAEAVLQNGLNNKTIDEAAEAASQECDPLDDLMGSAEYRRDMVRAYVRRALKAML